MVVPRFGPVQAPSPPPGNTICTFEGTDSWGNTVTAGSLCDGSWVGDIYGRSTWLRLDGSSSYSGTATAATRLSGTVPTELALLPQLTRLHLGDNDLSGTVPTELALLDKLSILGLDSNDLSGTVPTEVGLMTELFYVLTLHDNQFSGTIPQELANLSLNTCDLGGTNSWLCPLPDPPLASNCLAGYFTPDLSCSYNASAALAAALAAEPAAAQPAAAEPVGAIVGGVAGAIALMAVVVGGFFAYKKRADQGANLV